MKENILQELLKIGSLAHCIKSASDWECGYFRMTDDRGQMADDG
jgi:hypothetical protein